MVWNGTSTKQRSILLSEIFLDLKKYQKSSKLNHNTYEKDNLH